MNQQEKREQDRIYKAAKQQGELFYPNAIIKDAVVALLIFLVLIALSAFFRAELQAPADPTDSSYIPHPEWYFLFLYELLKFFPGNLVIVGVIILPGVVFLILFLLPWLDRGKERHPRKRPAVMALLTFAWSIIIGFTVLAFITAPARAETTQAVQGVNQQQASAGQELFIDNCSSCHGQYGEGGPNPNRLGSIITPISSHGFLTTFTNDTLFNIISNGLPDRGMAAFSQRNGGPLDNAKIELLVNYLRQWEKNPPVVAQYVPPPPSQPNGAALFTAMCAPCHGLYGEGGIGPTLATRDFSKAFPIDGLHTGSTSATNDTSQHVLDQMKSLTVAQLNAVLNYTYHLPPPGQAVVQAPSAQQGDASRGSDLYKSWCQNCHGTGGTKAVGKDQVVITDLKFLASMTDTQLTDVISKGFPKPDNMPAFREILSAQDMSDLLAWLRANQNK